VPFFGTLDVRVETLLSISAGCLFELIVLFCSRVAAELRRRRSEV
jgi:hypothetical protein